MPTIVYFPLREEASLWGGNFRTVRGYNVKTEGVIDYENTTPKKWYFRVKAEVKKGEKIVDKYNIIKKDVLRTRLTIKMRKIMKDVSDEIRKKYGTKVR